MLLSSEDSICIELGILLSSEPPTFLNSNKLFFFSIFMMRKAAGAGKCAFEMISCSYRLQKTKQNKQKTKTKTKTNKQKKNRPALLCKLGVFST